MDECIGSKTELFFAQIPSYNLSVNISFLFNPLSFENTIVQLKQFMFDALRNLFRNHLVYPNKITFFLPFAGRPADLKSESILSNSTSFSKNDAFIETTSRFIDEVLQLYKVELIPLLFSNNCKVFGFCPSGQIFHGYLGIKELAFSFHRAFSDSLLFDVFDISLDNNLLSFGFSCEGKMIGPFWDHYHHDELLKLKGRLKFNCKYEGNKCLIHHVSFIWDLEAAKIFTLPTYVSPRLKHFLSSSLRQTG